MMLSDMAGKPLAEFSYAAVFPAEAVSYHRRGRRGTRSERRREARTNVSKHPSRCTEEVGDGCRGELGLLPPTRWNLAGRAKKDGAEETHHRIGKAEDRAEEIRSPEKEETPEESEGGSEATRRGEG